MRRYLQLAASALVHVHAHLEDHIQHQLFCTAGRHQVGARHDGAGKSQDGLAVGGRKEQDLHRGVEFLTNSNRVRT